MYTNESEIIILRVIGLAAFVSEYLPFLYSSFFRIVRGPTFNQSSSQILKHRAGLKVLGRSECLIWRMFAQIRKAHEGILSGKMTSNMQIVGISNRIIVLSAESVETAQKLMTLWAKGSETYDTTDYFMPTGSSDNFHYWG